MYNHLPGIGKLLLLAIICAAYLRVDAQSLALSKNAAELALQPNQEQTADSRSLKTVLDEFERSYKVFFHYESDLIKDKNITRNEQLQASGNLEQALKNVLTPFNLTFKKLDNNYYLIYQPSSNSRQIKKIERKLDAQRSNTSSGEEASSFGINNSIERLTRAVAALKNKVITVSGKVTSDAGEALPGVNVLLKGTTLGTTTNTEGVYTLSVPEPNSNGTLVFSYIGFTTEEVAINGRTAIDVALVPDIKSLSEVVVVGYGTQKRSDLTGSIASVKAEEIKNLPARSLNEALQGRVAGVQVTKGNGAPGEGADIIIRGAGSLNGMPPLYIVDGIRMGTGYNFNIQDVESIEVLKDASAAAIYGAQAAGGVILVTTKRGKGGDKININFNAYYGIRQPLNLYELMNRDQFVEAKQAFGSDISGWGNINSLPDTDWVNELFDHGKDQSYSLSVSGGSAKANYYISGNYQREDGVRIDNWFQRYGLRINSDYNISKRLRVGETLFAWKGEFNPAQSGQIPFRSVPTMPVRDASNPLGGWGRQPAGGYYAGNNPVADERINHRLNQSYAVEGNIYADLEIINGLNLRTTLGASLIGGNNSTFREAFNYGSLAGNSFLNKYFSKQENYTANFVLTYGKTFGLHDVKVMAGYEAYREDRTDLNGEASEFTTPVAESFNLNSNPETQRVGGGLYPQRRLLSQFGRINYGYAGKYLLSANIRRDGSDRFGPANKWGVFPSVSAAWKIDEEAFFDGVPVINSLKLRGGYGILGNDGIGQFLYQASYGNQDLGGRIITGLPDGTRVPGYALNLRLANEQIKWEEVQQTDIGLDVGLWQDRLTFTFDWYSRQTKDMIYQVPVPQSSGLGSFVFTNIGQMSNKGVEFAANYRGNAGEFTYQIGANAAFNRNKVLLLDGTGNNPINDGSGGEYLESSISRTDVGNPMSQFYGYVTEGIFQTDQQAQERTVTQAGAGAGDLIFRDLNNDGEITQLDKAFIGNPWPKMTYGLNLSVGYKGFDITALFQGVQGVDVYNATKHFTQFLAGDYNSTTDVFGASFFNGNGLTDQPRVGFTNADGEYERDPNGNYTKISSYFVENGSYLRLSNLQVGYSLPKNLISAARLTNARIYLMAQNLLTITGYSGMDPEVLGSGFRNGTDTSGTTGRGIDTISAYPRTRLLSVGIDLTF